MRGERPEFKMHSRFRAFGALLVGVFGTLLQRVKTGPPPTIKFRCYFCGGCPFKDYALAKAFVEKSHPKTPLAGRTANINPATISSVRKALGNASKTLTSTKHQTSKGKKFVSVKKVTENTSRSGGCSMAAEDCPEKENLFPFNPLDFESFEVPEEHRLSHVSLTGVPLMTFGNAPKRFQNMVHMTGEPPSISWDFDTLHSTADFLATLDEIVIDLPSPM